MEIPKNLQLAWQNDSLYVKTTCINGADVFISGVIGFMAGRISGVISPRNGAICLVTSSVARKIANIFTRRIKSDDKELERCLKIGTNLVLTCIIYKGISSLSRQKGMTLCKGYFKFILTAIAIRLAIVKTLCVFFPSLKNPRPADQSK